MLHHQVNLGISFKISQKITSEISIPLIVGGGIKNYQDIEELLKQVLLRSL